MGGLGNGRRGIRSPPLMIGALIACILVLGFNYWVSSSRNLDLQTKLYELESQVRRGVAERGAAEDTKNKYQELIERQKEHISHIESQLEAQNTCSEEKRKLQRNISSSTKTIQELKGQLNQLNDDLGKLQDELQSCQGNTKTLTSQLKTKSLKECDEKVAAARLEVQKKMEKLVPSQHVSSQQDNTAVKEAGAVMTLADATVVSHTLSLSQPKGNTQLELQTNEIIVGKGPDAPLHPIPLNGLPKGESQAASSAAAIKQDILPPPEGAVKSQDAETETSKFIKNNLTEEKDIEFMDAHEEGTQTEDPGMEDMLIGQGKADETLLGQKLEEPEEYDGEEQMGGAELEKQQQSKQAENIGMEEELADYNGDDENEGEPEADKQAELAQN